MVPLHLPNLELVQVQRDLPLLIHNELGIGGVLELFKVVGKPRLELLVRRLGRGLLLGLLRLCAIDTVSAYVRKYWGVGTSWHNTSAKAPHFQNGPSPCP